MTLHFVVQLRDNLRGLSLNSRHGRQAGPDLLDAGAWFGAARIKVFFADAPAECADGPGAHIQQADDHQ